MCVELYIWKVLSKLFFCSFFNLSFPAVFLGLSHHFYLKVTKKKMMNEKEVLDWSPFLSSFSAFLYKMEIKSEQYFNQNEPKSHLKLTCT